MSSESKAWIGIYIVLITFVHIVRSLPLTEGKTPYDVVLPPDGDGHSLPPVIMLHGLMDWRKSWKMLAPEIAKNTGRKVYAYDAVNHGENKWTENFTGDMLLSELDNFIEQHNISKAILLGHSMGGRVAMAYCLRKPEKVEKLVIEDMITRKANSNDARLMTSALQSIKFGLEQYFPDTDELTAKRTMLRFLKYLLTKEQVKAMGKEFLMEWMPIVRRNGKIELLANLDLFLKMADNPTPENVDPGLDGQFNGDVLFLYGTKSLVNVSSDEMIPKYFPRATFVKFEGGHHVLHFEFFKEFPKIVSDFINGALPTEDLSSKLSCCPFKQEQTIFN